MKQKRELVVIGGAASALTAAIYAHRSGADVTVITDGYGGQINNTDVVENYLGFESITGPELAKRFEDHLKSYPIEEVKGDRVVEVRKEVGFEVELENGDVYPAESVVVATGGSRRHLDVPGEEEFRNRGVAYCAVCDGPLYQGEEVAIIGGGYAGTEAAEYMSDIASKVYLLSRSGNLTGEQITIDAVKEDENVKVIRGATTRRFEGGEMLDHVVYEMEGEEHELEVAAAFIEIGTVPNSELVEHLVDTDDSGYVKVNEEMETGVEGLYASGDVTTKGVQQLSVSSGQGCIAGLTAADYLKD
jgi:alkyl hydroperoxide reductase subunit F